MLQKTVTRACCRKQTKSWASSSFWCSLPLRWIHAGTEGVPCTHVVLEQFVLLVGCMLIACPISTNNALFSARPGFSHLHPQYLICRPRSLICRTPLFLLSPPTTPYLPHALVSPVLSFSPVYAADACSAARHPTARPSPWGRKLLLCAPVARWDMACPLLACNLKPPVGYVRRWRLRQRSGRASLDRACAAWGVCTLQCRAQRCELGVYSL